MFRRSFSRGVVLVAASLASLSACGTSPAPTAQTGASGGPAVTLETRQTADGAVSLYNPGTQETVASLGNLRDGLVRVVGRTTSAIYLQTTDAHDQNAVRAFGWDGTPQGSLSTFAGASQASYVDSGTGTLFFQNGTSVQERNSLGGNAQTSHSLGALAPVSTDTDGHPIKLTIRPGPGAVVKFLTAPSGHVLAFQTNDFASAVTDLSTDATTQIPGVGQVLDASFDSQGGLWLLAWDRSSSSNGLRLVNVDSTTLAVLRRVETGIVVGRGYLTAHQLVVSSRDGLLALVGSSQTPKLVLVRTDGASKVLPAGGAARADSDNGNPVAFGGTDPGKVSALSFDSGLSPDGSLSAPTGETVLAVTAQPST